MKAVEYLAQSALQSAFGDRAKAAQLLRDAADGLGIESGFHHAVRTVQLVACREFGVSLEEMLGSRRTERIARARLCAIVLCRELTQSGTDELAQAFNRLTHGTVPHAERTVQNRCETNDDFRMRFEQFRAAARAALAKIKGGQAA
jgi:chromosomal replication initiation ATPase DnaA